jgi:hypothetical protein
MTSNTRNNKLAGSIYPNSPVNFVPEGRCTAKTTAIAFGFIAHALANPNRAISIHDHIDSFKTDRACLDMIKKLIVKCDLKLFSYDNDKLTIKFNLYEYQPIVKPAPAPKARSYDEDKGLRFSNPNYDKVKSR